jgi:hypothetical protein
VTVTSGHLRRWFVGAFLPLAGVDALVVVVPRPILADSFEADLHVLAFQARYRRPTLLMAQGDAGVPTYFGPAPLVRELATLPFAAIPYRPYAFVVDVPPQVPASIDHVAPFQRLVDV